MMSCKVFGAVAIVCLIYRIHKNWNEAWNKAKCLQECIIINGSPTKENKTQIKVQCVGTAASGKSTLAKCLSSKHSLKYIKLDLIKTKYPKWKNEQRSMFILEIKQAINTVDTNDRNGWIIDGNDKTIPAEFVDHDYIIIWLDYSLFVIYWRLINRTYDRLYAHIQSKSIPYKFVVIVLSPLIITASVLKVGYRKYKRRVKYLSCIAKLQKDINTVSRPTIIRLQTPQQTDSLILKNPFWLQQIQSLTS